MTSAVLSPGISTEGISTEAIPAVNIPTEAQAPAASLGIGGQTRSLPWHWQGQDIQITLETLGSGAPVLLVPSLSMVSSRSEMKALAQYLSRRFRVMTFDWPGFGDSDRLNLNYSAAMYRQCLKDVVQELAGGEPVAAVAAGHGAGFTLQVIRECPELWTKVVALSPTWKSPFTSAGLRDLLGGVVRQVVRTPWIGSLIYRLNSSKWFLRLRHQKAAYTKPENQEGALLDQKQALTRKVGARHGAIAYVTGALDPVRDSQEFVDLFAAPPKKVLVLFGENVPADQQEDLEAIAALPTVQCEMLPGSLALHEEYAAQVAKTVTQFLAPPVPVPAIVPDRQWLGATIVGVAAVTLGLMAWAMNFT